MEDSKLDDNDGSVNKLSIEAIIFFLMQNTTEKDYNGLEVI
ncbi:MAG: hypothetical protein ACTSP4_12410 [Candidatus Hodarchaeales archaeon]